MADSSLGAVAELLKLLTGKGNSTTTKESTGGFTETTQKGLPPEAMQALIKTAMEGNQGLASVAGGQKSAGLYNSSTNQLLVNDLLARITGQAATLGAPTTVTRSPTSRTQTQSVQSPALKNSMPALAGMSLGKGGIDQLLGYGSKAHSLYSRGKDLFDWFAASESSIPSGAISAANATADPIGSLYTLTSGFSDAAPSVGAALSSGPSGISGLDFAESISALFSYPSVEAVNAGGELALMSAEPTAEAISPLVGQYNPITGGTNGPIQAAIQEKVGTTGQTYAEAGNEFIGYDGTQSGYQGFLESTFSRDVSNAWAQEAGSTLNSSSTYHAPSYGTKSWLDSGGIGIQSALESNTVFSPTASESWIDAYGLGGGMTEAYGAESTLFSPTASESWIDAGGLGGDVGASALGYELGSSIFGADAAASLAAGGGSLGGGFATGGAAIGELAAGEAVAGAAAGEAAGAAAGSVAGGAALGPALGIGGLVYNAGTILPAIGKFVTGWVICTELNSTGELSDTLYQATSPHFSRMHPDTIRGYQWWAIPYVKLMRKHTLFRDIVRPWAIGRARYLSGETSFLGWITVAVGEPICFLLGKTVARQAQDYEVLYGR